MLLSITTTYKPATDLGYLLHKHPDKVQCFDLSAAKAYVFYPEATENKCTACLMLDMDSIDMVRTLKIPGNSLMLKHYVNDRPYVASSFTSTAIAKVFSSALNGACKTRPELLEIRMPFEVNIPVLSVKGNEGMIEQFFEPLGYEIEQKRLPLDENFPKWGMSNYYALQLKHTLRLQELLTHLYVLLPVFDQEKHYWVDRHEIDKLLEKGKGWLENHPEKEFITRRYLKNLKGLARIALEKMQDISEETLEDEEEQLENEKPEIREKRKSLHKQRLEAVLEKLKATNARSVADLGCGEGKLLKMLLKESQFNKILGMDVSFSSLQRAKEKLYMDTMAPRQRERIDLIQGALTYRDKRLNGYDAAVLVEVIEHLDLDRLHALERVVFDFAQPKIVILTTPNVEYNRKYEFLEEGSFRHDDHRFEWTREEFAQWTTQVCHKFPYEVEIFPIGELDEEAGAPSQMAVFRLDD